MTKIKKHTSKSLVVLREFCQSTSLHGYSYLIIAESLFLKLLWLVVILGMTGLGIQFLITHTHEYLKGRVLTTVETYSAPLSVSWLGLKTFHTFFKNSQNLFFVCLGSSISLLDNLQLEPNWSFFLEKFGCLRK